MYIAHPAEHNGLGRRQLCTVQIFGTIMYMKKLLLVLLPIIGVGVVAFMALRSEVPDNAPAADEQASGIAPQTETVMRMGDAGYTPSNITIAAGDEATFINESSVPRWPASAIHPTHEIYPEFDPKEAIAPGASWSFTFDRAGLWRYHDHLNPTISGTITVE